MNNPTIFTVTLRFTGTYLDTVLSKANIGKYLFAKVLFKKTLNMA
ncbi:hypothetical protein MKX67_01145 [Cytobacillus sp. FSL W7-1323]|nr:MULTISPECIES: hypothetical protein [Cytobacillus]MEA1854769.1 hypothetical protein [Cytobacillus sp. OWB-43]MED1607603.1 hypothetical protein [Cytobacillus kochii]